MNQYKLIIFDLDGTILNTTEGILLSVSHTIQKYGLPMPSEEILRSFIGPPIQVSFKNLYELPDDTIQEMAVAFRNCYSSTEYLYKAFPYDGIYELFFQLKVHGYQIAIATYKREDYAIRLLRKFHFDKYTHIMFGGDNENKLKKKDIILKCLTMANITDRQKAIMVGDTEHDANGAKELGIDFIGVTYGFGFTKDNFSVDGNHIKKANCPLDIINCLS